MTGRAIGWVDPRDDGTMRLIGRRDSQASGEETEAVKGFARMSIERRETKTST